MPWVFIVGSGFLVRYFFAARGAARNPPVLPGTLRPIQTSVSLLLWGQLCCSEQHPAIFSLAMGGLAVPVPAIFFGAADRS